jgi:hypothetical protein
MPGSRASRVGQSIHENTTASSSLRWTARVNEVSLSSGTSSPRHSTPRSAPGFLKIAAAAETGRQAYGCGGVEADGTRIAVEADDITTQAGLVLPGGGQGLPGISMPDLEIREAHYRIEAPSLLEFAVKVEGMQWTRQRIEDSDVWQIEGASDGRSTLEPVVADAWLQMPRVLVSTFADNAALASTFARSIDAKAAPTESTRALARRMVGDRSTDEAKADAVYNWIRANLRYTAVWIGVDGWVPHDIDAILRNRYGDCKDLTLLMIALLRAVDVEAVPALLDMLPVYTSPPVGIGTNHVIAYLPGLQRFADPTAADVAFGGLPEVDRDKPVAVALAGGTRLLRTPAATVFGEHGSTLTVTSRYKIARNVSARRSHLEPMRIRKEHRVHQE